MMGVIIAFLAWAYVRKMDSVTIDLAGIRHVGPLTSGKMIRWADLVVQNDRSRQHLVLSDGLGDNKILLDNGLDGFAQAVELIRRRRPDLFQVEFVDSGKRYFTFSFWSMLDATFFLVFFGGIAALLLFFAVAGGKLYWLLLLFALAISSLPLVYVLTRPLFVCFDRQEIRVRYPLGDRRWLAQDIQAICLEVTRESGHQTRVRIIPRHGRGLPMLGLFVIGLFVGGPWLYCALKTWWEKSGAI
ncbi:MAG: hypothetical protein AB1894_16030 [Chloroflexota bacterium]